MKVIQLTMKNVFFSVFSCILICTSFLLHAQVFTNYSTINGLPDNYVNGVAVDANNNKWFGTQAGVGKFDNTNWTIYTTAQGLLTIT